VSNLTKAQLQAKVDLLETDLRRMNRALGQASIDLSIDEVNDFAEVTPHISEHALEAIKRAQAEWALNVREPEERIDTYIRSSAGLHWSWEEPYVKNGQFAWCGAFASFCYTKVRPLIRKKIFPSCYRLHTNWAKTSRYIHPDNLRAGDIVVVYSGKRAVQGDHITLCVDASEYLSTGSITTIEGNAHGTLGDGSRGEGVITRERARSEIAHVYRLLGEDFDE
jgi:hypothetical protein